MITKHRAAVPHGEHARVPTQAVVLGLQLASRGSDAGLSEWVTGSGLGG